ncbi:hypothetical protein KIN20_038226 [Parelaphostrongylus tenuis]|uniref:Uncharacterized protein n=1 Tax=Parelaphostrongylus tenuis TaxID=148309 RepID=A0AAD5WLF8_PARTN|nr:hypothetical protein KIN20_038226 [Parelaphostrongylus tenuis]
MQVGHDLEEVIPRMKMRRYEDSRKMRAIAIVVVKPWQSYNGYFEAQAQEYVHFFKCCVFPSEDGPCFTSVDGLRKPSV